VPLEKVSFSLPAVCPWVQQADSWHLLKSLMAKQERGWNKGALFLPV
jgi:hypothetical protein